MSTMDRVLVGVAGALGCLSLFLAFLSVTQLTLRPRVSATDLMFLVVVTGTIVGLGLTRRSPGSLSDTTARLVVARRPLLIAGCAGALVLIVLTRVLANMDNPGSSSITLGPIVTMAGFIGVGMLGVWLRRTYQRRSYDQGHQR